MPVGDPHSEDPQRSWPRHLGTSHERWLALEHKNAEQAIELSPEQAAFLKKLNPCFRERHIESERPGQLLSADTFMVGTLKGIGRVYLHAVVDTFGSYAFGFLHVSKQPEAAVAVLHNDVVPLTRLAASEDFWSHRAGSSPVSDDSGQKPALLMQINDGTHADCHGQRGEYNRGQFR